MGMKVMMRLAKTTSELKEERGMCHTLVDRGCTVGSTKTVCLPPQACFDATSLANWFV